MKNKELLLEAVAHYEILAPSHRKILQILIELAVNNVIITSPSQLHKIAGYSRQLVYKALHDLAERQLIELKKIDKGKLGSIILVENKLDEVTKHYKLTLQALKKYKEVKK